MSLDWGQNGGGFIEKLNPALKRSAARRNNPASSPWVDGGGERSLCRAQVECRPPTPSVRTGLDTRNLQSTWQFYLLGFSNSFCLCFHLTQALDLTQDCMFTTVQPRVYSAPIHTSLALFTSEPCTLPHRRSLNAIVMRVQY